MINLFYKFIKHFKDLGFYERNPELFEFHFKEMSKEEYLMLYFFIEAIKKLSQNNDKFDIVLRPHPRQPIDLEEFF